MAVTLSNLNRLSKFFHR